jgi:hypothetical protein
LLADDEITSPLSDEDEYLEVVDEDEFDLDDGSL